MRINELISNLDDIADEIDLLEENPKVLIDTRMWGQIVDIKSIKYSKNRGAIVLKLVIEDDYEDEED